MATLQIIACGQLKERYLRDGIAEYVKRLGRYVDTEIMEVADAPDTGALAVQLAKEGDLILAKIPAKTFVIALEIEGKMVDSEQFAAVIERGLEQGGASLTFVIGGSRGLDRRVLARADLRLSFSQMTFPHQLMRLILLEQIYRAFRILRGEPYHK